MKLKVCQKCGKGFPGMFVTSDNKVRVGSSRKYCLECSPFGGRNTATLIGDPNYFSSQRRERGGVKVRVECNRCARVYTFDNMSRKGHTQTTCNSCSVNGRRSTKKRRAVEYMGGACSRCGYNKCDEALHFHHAGGKKDFVISGSYMKSWAEIQAELDKCILVCANCHAEIHSSPPRSQVGMAHP